MAALRAASRHFVSPVRGRARLFKLQFLLILIQKFLKMCDFRTYSHELLTEFIEAFRNNPCLWKIRSNDYKDKNLKLQAYNNLLEIIRKVERDATIENVKKKINSLRAGFRKEHKKVQDSKKTGSGTDQVYVPKLWYYSQLEFLKDQAQGKFNYLLKNFSIHYYIIRAYSLLCLCLN